MKGCIGAIYGWLCPIRVPRKTEVTRVRGFFSGHYQRDGVNVQACCDHLSRFTAVSCSSPGGTGDAVAFLKWRLSLVVNNLPSGLYVVGDNAYTNSNHLLTPFLRPRISTAAHDSYNFHHYRRLYESSDLSFDADTYNNSEWIRDAIVELLEREPILRPRRNRVRREQEEKEHH
ncbi:hypothetical protein JG688_00011795 [Phytophthora aleatoria]|uniref:DDE Tnp4 domain-containing protein n=1 Tax=Phytophthora aleatoria TaxID=2496075 RepID=A0A8J5MEL1_9STRA|nr:hypothetical protein JG688_00011795 [Phytophthora aleatoria]